MRLPAAFTETLPADKGIPAVSRRFAYCRPLVRGHARLAGELQVCYKGQRVFAEAGGSFVCTITVTGTESLMSPVGGKDRAQYPLENMTWYPIDPWSEEPGNVGVEDVNRMSDERNPSSFFASPKLNCLFLNIPGLTSTNPAFNKRSGAGRTKPDDPGFH